MVVQQQKHNAGHSSRWAVAVLVCALMGAALFGAASPASAQTARQKDKNLMRNLGIGLGAAAVWQATKGKTTNAAVLAAGAALAGKKYEDARKAQTRENDWRGSGDWRGSDDWRRDDGRYDERYDDDYRRPVRSDYRRSRSDDGPRYVGSANHPGKHKGWSKGKGNSKKVGKKGRG